MSKYILPLILLVIADLVFLQNKKPIQKRPMALDDPWGPLLYIPLSAIGMYLLFREGVIEVAIGWLAAIAIASILNSLFGILNRGKLK